MYTRFFRSFESEFCFVSSVNGWFDDVYVVWYSVKLSTVMAMIFIQIEIKNPKNERSSEGRVIYGWKIQYVRIACMWLKSD